MVGSIFEHIGIKIKSANLWLDTFAVNCIELPVGEGLKRVVNLEGAEKTDEGFSDVNGSGFYIKINPRFTYTEQRALTSEGSNFLVTVNFKFVFFNINNEIEYNKLTLENIFSTNFREMSFSDYVGVEKNIKLSIRQTNVDAIAIFKEEIGKDYDLGSESVFVSLEGTLSFLSSNSNCETECGISTSESVLKSFDFCDQNILGLLTTEQRLCLQEEFGGGGTCLGATVENSDVSYTNTVASGGTLVLPDQSIEVYLDGSLVDTVVYPAMTEPTIDIVWN